MAQIKILLSVLSSKVDVVQSLAEMHRAQHAGVASSYIKLARIAIVPVCKPLYHIQIWLLLNICLSKRAGRGMVLCQDLWRSTMESTRGDINGRLGRALLKIDNLLERIHREENHHHGEVVMVETHHLGEGQICQEQT
jgi:hypothetical protein